MRRLITAAAVCASVGLVVAPDASAALKPPKQVSGTVTINPIIPAYAGYGSPVSGNLATSRYCRNGRTVEFLYGPSNAFPPSNAVPRGSTQTGPNGEFSGHAPGLYSQSGPGVNTYPMLVKVLEQERTVRVKKKGKRKTLRFYCLEAIAQSSLRFY